MQREFRHDPWLLIYDISRAGSKADYRVYRKLDRDPYLLILTFQELQAKPIIE